MRPTPQEILDNAEVLGRVGTFTGSVGLPPLLLNEALTAMGAEPGRWMRLSLDHTGKRASVTCRWGEDDALWREWAASKGWGELVERAASIQPPGQPSGGRLAEVGFGDGGAPECHLHLVAERNPEQLSEALSAAGLPAHVVRTLLDQAGFVAGGGGTCEAVILGSGGDVAVRISCPIDPQEALNDTASRVLTHADDLGVTKAQQGLFTRTFPILARGKKRCLVGLSATDQGANSRIDVEQVDVPFEHVLRLFVGLYPDSGAPERLGALAGAFQKDRAAGFELSFTTTEPPPARVSVELSSR